MVPSKTTLREITTTLPADEVMKRAKAFFGRRPSLYAAFVDRQGENFCTFRGQGGEEIVIAATKTDAGTRVTGSTYLFDMQIARFFATLPEPAGAPAAS
jgi:hypothetical protein